MKDKDKMNMLAYFCVQYERIGKFLCLTTAAVVDKKFYRLLSRQV